VGCSSSLCTVSEKERVDTTNCVLRVDSSAWRTAGRRLQRRQRTGGWDRHLRLRQRRRKQIPRWFDRMRELAASWAAVLLLTMSSSQPGSTQADKHQPAGATQVTIPSQKFAYLQDKIRTPGRLHWRGALVILCLLPTTKKKWLPSSRFDDE